MDRAYAECDRETVEAAGVAARAAFLETFDIAGIVRGKGVVAVDANRVSVTYAPRAHNPILRRVEWRKIPMTLLGIASGETELHLELK